MSIWAADEYVENARIKDVHTTEYDLVVNLEDGRVISVPLIWYPRLFEASAEQRADWLLVGGGHGIHWPQIDEDLSVEGLILGIPASASQPSSRRGAEAAREMWADILAEETGIDVRKVSTGRDPDETGLWPISSSPFGIATQAAGQAQNAAGEAAQQAQDLTNQFAQHLAQLFRQGERWAQDAAGRGGQEEPDATQAAKRKAEELGVDLSRIEGSGAGGRITVKDVEGQAQITEQVARQRLKATEQMARLGLMATEQVARQGMREAVERTDKVLRQTEEATRRAELRAAVLNTLKTEDYDELTVDEISERLEGLSAEELRKVREFEKRKKDRVTLLEQIDRRINAGS